MDGEKNIEMKMKEKIDLERTIITFGLYANVIMWILLIANIIWWHSQILSCYITGWNLCTVFVFIIAGVVGHKNYKYDMEQFKWLLNHIGELEMMESEYMKEEAEENAKKEKDNGAKCDK